MQTKPISSPFMVAVVTIWAAWIVINFTQRIYYADNPGEVAYIWLEVRLIQGFNGILATLLLFAVYGRLIKETSSSFSKAVWVIMLTYLFSLILVVINMTVYRYFFQKLPLFLPWQRYLFTAFTKYFIILGLSIFYFLILHWQALQREKEKTVTAVALASEARLKMLQYQLNPHFLFNALNSIRTLVYEDPEKADKIITDLSDLLRYALSNDNHNMVTLSDELSIITNYLKIQKIRFEDRLLTDIDVSTEARNYKVPSFLIHPLVENAVKYGLETSPPPLKIDIRAIVEGNTLEAHVQNTGRLGLNKNIDGFGTGLNNIRMRLEHFFPGRNSLDLFEADGSVHAIIKITLPTDNHWDTPKGNENIK